MKSRSKITDIIFDYDGTCTQIPPTYKGFQDSYFKGFAEQMDLMHQPITYEEWLKVLDIVRENSPLAGWTVATCPSAPAAADPYIQAFEAACFILRDRKNNSSPDSKIFSEAYKKNPSPWRDDAAITFKALQRKDIQLHIISNSSTAAIQEQLKLLPGIDNISVKGGAAKFRICEPVWDPGRPGGMPDTVKKQFTGLPAACTDPLVNDLGRPAYLKRGFYFEAICRALGNNLSEKLSTTVFCGDIWELDLAMPYALGANIHLMERVAPFVTYAYERKIVEGYGKRGRTGKNLSDLLAWLDV